MHHSLLAASPIVVCLMLAAAPESPEDEAALIESNEAAAIGDLRTIMSAEDFYQRANGGFYDTLACLATPSNCIPGYPADGPFYLGEDIAALTVKDGYGRAFSWRPPAQKPGQNASRTSVGFYAVVLWPDEVGKTGQRGFCGDADGFICFTTDGSMPKLGKDGRCPWEERDGKPAGCELLH